MNTYKQVHITDSFWKKLIDRNSKEIIPFQYEVLNDGIPGIPESHAIENFRIAAGLSTGKFSGMLFQDSDVAKWIEAASYSLAVSPDPDLEEKVDDLVRIIAQAQQDDGYLNTFYSRPENGERFSNIAHGHELYCAGHMTEAAVAYYESTGKRNLLDIVEKYVAYLMKEIGPGDNQRHIYSGHPEIELALYRLYKVTGKQEYLDFASWLVDTRGTEPNFLRDDPYLGERYKDKWFALEYHQAHKPVREQTEAVGHSVRAMYLYCAMADIASETGDPSLKQALDTLWKDVTGRKMYLIGGIGSEAHGESFSCPYDLPNDRVYAETCASIGLFFWARRMFRLDQRSCYPDVMEQALYNNILDGMSLDGKKYNYANPLEVVPEVNEARYDLQHAKTERVSWFGCACCPPNIARLLGSLNRYVYDFDPSGRRLSVLLYMENSARFELADGTCAFHAETEYPRSGTVRFVCDEPVRDLALCLRIPGWCRHYTVRVNDREKECTVNNGYIEIRKDWQTGESVDISFEINPRFVFANTKVREDSGKVALMYGPVVYCLEECDNAPYLSGIVADPSVEILLEKNPVEDGLPALRFDVRREKDGDTSGRLYTEVPPVYENASALAIPYYEWGNRGRGEMTVWFRRSL